MQPAPLKANTWTCSCCGQVHTTIPFSFAADFPDNYANMTQDERDNRAAISSDQCIIDGSEFWIRGCLKIPIRDTDEVFLWGLWANLFEEDFDTIQDHWETPNRENLIGPFKARLGNKLTLYPSTSNLKLRVQIEPLGTRPKFFIDELHKLQLEQQEGISLDTARRYSCRLMNPVSQLPVEDLP